MTDASEPRFETRHDAFEERMRASFARQRVMGHLEARLARVEAGRVEIVMPFQPHLTQQHGFTHAGILATLVDTACGYAAFSLMAADTGVLTVEFKINLMAPAVGESFLARGEVVRPGRTLTFCEGKLFARQGDESRLVASVQATIMTVRQRPDVRD